MGYDDTTQNIVDIYLKLRENQIRKRGFLGLSLEKRYVRCKVLLGNFASEFYVVLYNSSALVSRENVKLQHPPEKSTEEVDGQLLVYLISQERDRALVQIPGEPVIGGLRTWVPQSAFASA